MTARGVVLSAPRRQASGRIPPAHATINRSHPLAVDLEALILPTPGGMRNVTNNQRDSRSDFVRRGSYGFQTAGSAAKFSSVAYTSTASAQGRSEVTLFFASSGASGDARYFSDANTLLRLAGGTTGWDWFSQPGSVSGFTRISTGSTSAGVHMLGVSHQGTNLEGYLDGRVSATGTSTATATVSGSGNMGAGSGDSTIPGADIIIMQAIWSRALTATDHATLWRDPYCFLRW